MSNNPNQNDIGSKLPLKPIVLPSKIPFMRTVSASATLGDSSQTSSENTNKDSGVKLNTNAPVFVPKEKRGEQTTTTTKIEKENTPSTTTQPPQQGFNQNFSGMNVPPFQNPPKNFGQNSFVGYTYLAGPGTQIPMGYPQGYTPSPNRMQPGSFFPGTMPMQMGYQQFPPQPFNQNIIPKYPITPGQTTPGFSNTNVNPNLQNVQPNMQPTALNAPNPDKKFTFNKDSKVFIPKALRTTTQESEVDKIEKEPEKNEKPEETEIIKEEIPIKTDTTEKIIKEEKVSQPQDEKTQSQISENTEQIANENTQFKEEPKKSEKKSKLSDLLENPDKKPASGPKNAPINKKIIVYPVQSNVKTNDVQKTFEEKRKQFITQQKKDSNRSSLPPIKRDREPQKEEKEQISQPKADTPIPSDEEDEPEEIKEEPKKFKLDNHYFLKEEGKEDKTKRIFSVEYLLSFQNWKICSENKLLNEMLQKHLEKMNTIYEDERPRGYKDSKKGRRDMQESKFGRSSIQPSGDTAFTRSSIKLEPQSSLLQNDLAKWGRKDMSEAERIAQETKVKLEEYRKLDPVRNQLTEFLNILTVDNYEEIKAQIFDKIKEDVEDQKKFLEVLFKKAVSEKAFVSLYAKICKELDRDMPQKSEKDTRQSKMRSYLVDKCREIFKTDYSKIDQYIKETDPEERQNKLKKFLLGNVNFIAELINSKLLSKKIVFQCIANLFTRIEKEDEQGIIKLINIEAIVILMDKFGTLINIYDTKIKPEELVEFNNRIDDYLNRLDNLQANDTTIHGHIRFKIINLIEKRKRGWEESKVDKTSKAKGIKEVREEYESEQRTGRGPNKLDQDGVNNMVRDDLYAFRDHIKNGYNPEEYHWSIIDQILNKYKNSPAEVLTAFGENCIDFVGKQEDINTAYSYYKEIITFYEKNWSKREKNEILDVTLYFLQNLNDFSLDNNLLVDVWGGIIYLLEFYKIFSFYDLDRLKDVQEEQLKTIFEVCHNALSYYEKSEIKLKEIESVTLAKSNKTTFHSIFEA